MVQISHIIIILVSSPSLIFANGTFSMTENNPYKDNTSFDDLISISSEKEITCITNVTNDVTIQETIYSKPTTITRTSTKSSIKTNEKDNNRLNKFSNNMILQDETKECKEKECPVNVPIILILFVIFFTCSLMVTIISALRAIFKKNRESLYLENPSVYQEFNRQN